MANGSAAHVAFVVQVGFPEHELSNEVQIPVLVSACAGALTRPPPIAIIETTITD